MDSLLPRIWAVEAVGMGEMRRLFLTPYLGTAGTVRGLHTRDTAQERAEGTENSRDWEIRGQLQSLTGKRETPLNCGSRGSGIRGFAALISHQRLFPNDSVTGWGAGKTICQALHKPQLNQQPVKRLKSLYTQDRGQIYHI